MKRRGGKPLMVDSHGITQTSRISQTSRIRRINRITRIKWFIGLLVAGLFLGGCTESAREHDNEYLIKVGGQKMTVSEFNMAFEMLKTAYSYDFDQRASDLKKARIRLLDQIIEEMLILQRGKELGITVADTEVEATVDTIKKDFPDDTFEKTLLEYAISYTFWKQRLKTRLLIEKIIRKDLTEHTTVTPEEISRQYLEELKLSNENNKKNEPKLDEAAKDIKEKTIDHIQRKKAEPLYPSWIKKLQEKYPADINHERWKAILQS
jgi:hypothetical protein